MTFFNCFHAILFGTLLVHQAFGKTDANRQHGKADLLRRGQAQSILAIFNQFKERNQLKDDFNVGANLKDILGETFSIDGQTISIKNRDLVPITDIFTEGATYSLNGVQQSIPTPAVFRSKSNSSWKITKTGDSILQAIKTDPVTGETTTNLVSVVPGLADMLVEIRPSDLDKTKLEKFKLEEDYSRRTLRKFEDFRTDKKQLRSLQGPCQEFRVIEVASK